MLDELLASAERPLDERGPCDGRPHVLAVATASLSGDTRDQLQRWMSAGREAHLVLRLPPSPVSRDPELHLLWERRMARDVAERAREVALLGPGEPLVRIDVIRTRPTAGRGRRARLSARRTR